MASEKKLYIIGAGALGRELESWISCSPRSENFRLAGFLHSGKSEIDQYPTDLKIVGDWNDFVFSSTDEVLIGVADPAWKKRIYDTLKDRVAIHTYIHPDVLVGKYTSIGEGSVILPRCSISCNVNVGRCVTINFASQLGHDCSVGDFASIMVNVIFSGWCGLGESSFVGSGTTVIPKIKVGSNVMIGAGSVVVCKIKDGFHAFGNPAVPIEKKF